ncbi:uncharacterized protein JCM15063_003689 [Sporobolomyces koalae]|uniref:uncharacterized protein n=1 Tax=Sporobolomyces koalae TaxID=500713 RepID=UPI003179B4E4
MGKKSNAARFPLARIKKMIQADEDVGKVAQATPIVVSKALELFLASLVEASVKDAETRGSKKLTPYGLKRAINATPTLDFCADIVEGVPDPQGEEGDEAEGGKKKRKARASASTGASAGASTSRKKKSTKAKDEDDDEDDDFEFEDEDNEQSPRQPRTSSGTSRAEDEDYEELLSRTVPFGRDSMDSELEIYDFESLAVGESDLAGLLDEDSNAFNDETFGDVLGNDAPLGRDFDFAGSTNRFLGTDAAAVPALSRSNHAESPWGSLNHDPLLARAPQVAYAPANFAQANPSESSAVLADSTQSRRMKTLEEVEAEMRQGSLAQAAPLAAPTPRPLTVEEVEAEMLRNARQHAAVANVAPAPVASNGIAPAPNHEVHAHAPFTPAPLPMIHPGMPPAMIAMLQAQYQQQERMRIAQSQALGGQGVPPLANPNIPLSHGAFPPLGSAPAVLPAGVQANAPPGNLMATLFPPLAAQPQQQVAPAADLAQVEQQLHYLSMNHHAQHPALTSAHLHALLQQAQNHVAAGGSALGPASPDADEDEDRQRRAAGEEIIKKVEMRILEHEMLEMARKKKAMKIASMAKHNNLMSNSDKDFITRIQVSQLITDDPYADDFYFHIMAAIKNARQNAVLAAIQQNQGLPVTEQAHNTPAQPAQTGTQAPHGTNRRTGRRENAMSRMAQNVQRLVDSAKKRNANTPNTLSLDGALGKIATRTRSAPRPLLQVTPSSAAATNAASASLLNPSEALPPPSTSALPHNTGESLLTGAGLTSTSSASKDTPTNGHLTRRAALAVIEQLYDTVLDLEQLRRVQPALLAEQAALRDQFEQMTVEGEVKDQTKARFEDAVVKVKASEAKYEALRELLWQELRVMDPLDTGVEHPFISILSILKGKRLLPRAIRHLSAEQTLTLLTLLIATFDTLDVVVDAPLLDQLDTTGSLEARQRRVAVEAKTEALLNAIIAPVMQVVGTSQLRMVTGMLGLLLDRNDLNQVVRSKPGLAFLTILLARAESLNQSSPPPEPTDVAQWHRTFTYLFSVLSTSLLTMFPSSRMASSVPFGVAQYQSVDALRPEADLDDEPVWRFLAAVAVCADPEQQQVLVTGVRDKVIEGVKGAKMGRGGPEVAALKIRNVNLLLHALSLDASMIEIDE